MKRCFGQLRAVVGNPFSPPHRKLFRERFGVTYIAANQYASTEGYCITSVPYGTEAPQGSAGRRNDDYDVILTDDEGREVPPGQAGEILYRPRRANIMFEGYWRRPDKTAEAWRDLWMHTGDMARFDDDGYLFFVERKKDYIRRRGENVSSWEVSRPSWNIPPSRRSPCTRSPATWGRTTSRSSRSWPASPYRLASCSCGRGSGCPPSPCRGTSSSATSCPRTGSAAC
jgi:hypothetical protein